MFIVLSRQSQLMGIWNSTRRAGFEEVHHAPDAVDFAALDDLEGLRAAEGFVRGLQPTGKLFGGRERLTQLGIQSADFNDRAQ